MKTWILLLFCAACHRRGGDAPSGPDRPGPQDDSDLPSGRFTLDADDAVALPFVTAGETVPDGALTVREVGGLGSTGELTLSVSGDFEVTGSRGPLAADEERALTVRYTGASDAALISTGTLTITVDDQQEEVALAAVVGDPELPEATWTEDEYGRRAIVELPSAPFPYGSAPYDDSSVLIFAPAHLTDQGDLGVVTHLHGHNATLEEVVAAQYIVEQHALSGLDAVLIVPQGPEEAADGDFGRLDTEGGHAALVRDAVSVLYRDGLITRPVVGANALSSHSGGYLAVSHILEQGGLPIDAVHLFDSLYGEESVYEEFARSGATFRSVYTASGGTDDNNRALRSTLRDAGLTVCEGWDDDNLERCAVTIGASEQSHSGCVYEQRAYGRWLAASGLRRSPMAPPRLVAATFEDGEARLRFRPEIAPGATSLEVQESQDGQTWETVKAFEAQAGAGTAVVSAPAAPWIRLRANHEDLGQGAPSNVVGATGSDWLVVDGFDRVLGGSYTAPTHDFGARLGAALGAGFSVASHDAVGSGEVELGDYARVLWFLGDESSSDLPLDEAEMAALESWLDAGGELIITGSELGYAGDADWLSRVLHASYVSDDAGTTTAAGRSFGVVYDEDYPDVWTGDEVIWSYSTGGAAAVGWDHQIVVVGFPLESMGDETLADALAELVAWLDG